ncbi:MAG: RNA polymerase factor sigma-54 [Phycisphaeraceae bacterium]|nr:RNA polymerase factor sigma-54 [Phycisphaeraceae bacterium]
MRFDVGQQMRMQQQMKLSPRMIQSMEILQLPAMALEQRIDQELEQNPVLEMAAPETDQETRSEKTKTDRTTEAGSDGESFEHLADFSEQYSSWDQNTQETAEYRPVRRSTGDRDGKMDAMANTAAPDVGLTDQLLDQWRFMDLTPPVREAGEYLIRLIEDDGYLRQDTETLTTDAPAELQSHIPEALELIRHKLDPAGIGARNLSDCLRLQLDRAASENGSNPVLEHARLLMENHQSDLEKNRLPKIVRSSGLTMEQIKAALEKLKRLDPFPGRRLAPPPKQIVIPDVLVEYEPMTDRYVAALNRGRQPALRINPTYESMAADKKQDRKARKYLGDQLGHARWLIDALQQRSNTLLRVVNVVLDVQREFLDHGPEHLRPLPMVQVADQLGIHVGTVSRAVADKYIQTPRGIYPLRMFFSGGTESADGQEMSWSAVQAKLKQIVESEDPSKPLSDDKLAEKLKEQGIEIARRTVAKYRQQLNIPPARRRKQY